MSAAGAPVFLRVYDISDGIATTWSPILLGKQLEGVWHTGVEVFGYEYFFGGGIVKMRPHSVEDSYGITPTRVHHLGLTSIPQRDFEKFLSNLDSSFNRELYDLVNWNCNNFTDHVCRFLLNRGIPSYILDLPEEVAKTFAGKIIINFMKMFSDAPAVDSEAATHPRQVLSSRSLGSRNDQRRNSCPASPSAAKRNGSVAAAQFALVVNKNPVPPPQQHIQRKWNVAAVNDAVGMRERSGSADDSALPDRNSKRSKSVCFRQHNIPPISALRGEAARRAAEEANAPRPPERRRRGSLPNVNFSVPSNSTEKANGPTRQTPAKPRVRQRSKSVAAIDMKKRCSLT